MALREERFGHVLQAVGDIRAQDDVHQVAERVGNLNKVARFRSLPVLVQLLLDEADASATVSGDRTAVGAVSMCAPKIR